MSYDIAAINIK